MIEFLRKFENLAIKIGWDNSILMTKIYKITVIYFNFVRCWDHCDVDIFKLTASAQSIYWEVYDYSNSNYLICILLFIIVVSYNSRCLTLGISLFVD